MLPTTLPHVGLDASSRSASQHACAGVQGIDGHLRRRRGPRDLDPAVEECLGCGWHQPLVLADLPCLREEVQSLPMRDSVAASTAGGEQLTASRIEAAMQFLHEGERIAREDLLAARDVGGTDDLDGHAAAALFRG